MGWLFTQRLSFPDAEGIVIFQIPGGNPEAHAAVLHLLGAVHTPAGANAHAAFGRRKWMMHATGRWSPFMPVTSCGSFGGSKAAGAPGCPAEVLHRGRYQPCGQPSGTVPGMALPEEIAEDPPVPGARGKNHHHGPSEH